MSSLFDCFSPNLTGAPGCDYKSFDFCLDYEPNAGFIRQASLFVKENPGIVTLLALIILAGIIVCSTYYGFGDFHHFAEWINNNPSAFTAILIGAAILGGGSALLIYSKPEVPEEEKEPKLTIEKPIQPKHMGSVQTPNPSADVDIEFYSAVREITEV